MLKKRPRAQSLCELAPLCQYKLGVPCVLLNATIYNVEKKLVEDMQNYDLIYVRDSASRKYLERHGLNSNVVPGLSFLSRPTPREN